MNLNNLAMILKGYKEKYKSIYNEVQILFCMCHFHFQILNNELREDFISSNMHEIKTSQPDFSIKK